MLAGANARRVAEFEAQRALNNELARLMAFAFHKPAKLPDYKPMSRKQRADTSPQVDDERVRAFFIGLATRKVRA
ncbi:hypothetical protein [Pseudooceanicola nanhaiensis]|uniref:hypothetical protein n=1 Tax=Pseudooceanicola nanhaiensis TaxID=375761 RepID=UPI00351638E2